MKIKHKQESQDEFRRSLRKSGYKITPARLAIFKAMAQSKTPLSAQGIIETIGEDFDPVTTYRTLKSFELSGIIKPIDLRHNHAHYELVDPEDHHHILCLKCGRIENFLGCNVEVLQKEMLKHTKYFSDVSQHSLEFYGVCHACSKRA